MFAIFELYDAELVCKGCVSSRGKMLDLSHMYEWNDWRRGVVAEIRNEFREQFSAIEDDEIDWDAWLPLFLEGCPPRLAVDKAFVRHG